jgi:1D-myo-inositol-tetrakisphosphate 5-kinase/inositol-polyphosphate multikinase
MSAPDYLPLAHQVAGHASGVLASSSGAVVVKPCLPVELAFYTALGPKLSNSLVGMWTPKFYGTLKLQGRLNQDGKLEQVDVDARDKEVNTLSHVQMDGD